MFTTNLKKKMDEIIGPLPADFAPWKALLTDSKKEEKIRNHFTTLKGMHSFGAELAVNYLKKTREIAQNLVQHGVANSDADVNAVLTNGFYWLYGPINDYL